MSLGSLAAALAVAAAVVAPVDASAGIADTKHNLRSGAGGQNKFTSGDGNTEICVFCHTPHGADTTAAVPLWNRNISSPPAYQKYSDLKTSTLDGTVVAVGSVSLACLSCHDGTQAMSTVINAPGSGGYSATGYDMLANIAGSSWGGSNVSADGKIAGGITKIDTDLRNDHPIGIQYAGGGVTATVLTGKDTDFKPAVTKVLNGTRVWWVDTEATPDGDRQKSDMILYTREIVAGTPEPFVECASCHDPHVSGASNPTFLRIANTGSAVCLACHTK